MIRKIIHYMVQPRFHAAMKAKIYSLYVNGQPPMLLCEIEVQTKQCGGVCVLDYNVIITCLDALFVSMKQIKIQNPFL